MSVLAKMEARLARGEDLGVPCVYCREPALACAVEYLSTGKHHRCCRRCDAVGALRAHVEAR